MTGIAISDEPADGEVVRWCFEQYYAELDPLNRTLTEAIALYRRRGYREVAPFNDEPYADFWFEKHLPAEGTP